ncbi:MULTISPECIES: molybdopterin-dependent oxidoreductase [unclassified Marinovum]
MTHTTKRTFSSGLMALAAIAMSASGAWAEMMDAPKGDIILTVSGNIHAHNNEDTAAFDLDMLKALPTTEFTTSTIWTDGPQTFTGVELKTFLETLDAHGDIIEATAINDYAVEIPMTDAVEGGAMLAYLSDGEEMSRRDKGPIWLVYPFDSNDDYRSETIYSRSIWQLDRLSVK